MFDRLEVMDLYSRQIGAFGVETMKNLITLDVLILGLRGVGAEAAKVSPSRRHQCLSLLSL
jgi:molybdopterin/thiamine biosynthesis adenylyltransferase